MTFSRPPVRCREIGVTDLGGILALLQTGFPERSHDHWTRALKRLEDHSTPAGLPKFGYLLETEGTPVGVILVIFSSLVVGGETRIRGNVTGWYVVPEYRIYATMLTSHALAHKNVTFLNISPARHTWPILQAQGYRRFGAGQFISLPILQGVFSGAQVRVVKPDFSPGADLTPSEVEILLAHAKYGCFSVTCDSPTGRRPFVFARAGERVKSIWLPYALLAYCRDVEDFVQCAGPLGRFLARRGMPLVLIDANGPIPGLVGRFVEWGPRYFKGPHPPRLGDVTYTERVMFGL